MINLSIRQAITNDINVINHLFFLSKGSWGYDEAFMHQCMSEYSITIDKILCNAFYLFYVDEVLAGFYSFIQEVNERAELDYFFLHPNYFGKGIGLKLWDACINTAKNIKITEFILYSDPNAEAFYLKMGCRKIGEQESPMIKGRLLPVLVYYLT